jgi:capsular polysaccharide transport system permease protein
MTGVKQAASSANVACSADGKNTIKADEHKGSNPPSRHFLLLKQLLDTPPAKPQVEVQPKEQPEVEPAKAAAGRGWLRFAAMHLRHQVIAITFILAVLVPGALASIYMLFIAQDQYHSAASFSVRSIESSSASDVLGMFTQASSGSTVSDSYILMDFVRSEKMVKMVDAQFNLDQVYGQRGWDFFYALSKGSPIESKLEFWRSVVTVNFDHTSGIVDLQVKAFDPVQARKIAAFVIQESEKLVNDLSSEARKGVLESAHQEVFLAERRLLSARSALLEYRDRAQEVDPSEGAKMAAQLISSLELQLVQLNSDLATARSQMSDNSPRVRVLKNQIASLEEQIRLERSRLGSGTQSATKTGRETRSNDVASRIAEYEGLETEREFAERAYSASLTSLEKARMDANNRQRYLAVFLTPTTSEWAQYPARMFNSLLVIALLLFFWSVALMGYYNIRDRN